LRLGVFGGGVSHKGDGVLVQQEVVLALVFALAALDLGLGLDRLLALPLVVFGDVLFVSKLVSLDVALVEGVLLLGAVGAVLVGEAVAVW